MRLCHLVQNLREGKSQYRPLVVTFDDGYADNLYNAKPLLERYEIPATIFLTSGCIGQNREFWWDELDRMLLQPKTLPRALHLNIDGTTHDWDLGKRLTMARMSHSTIATGDPGTNMTRVLVILCTALFITCFSHWRQESSERCWTTS